WSRNVERRRMSVSSSTRCEKLLDSLRHSELEITYKRLNHIFPIEDFLEKTVEKRKDNQILNNYIYIYIYIYTYDNGCKFYYMSTCKY
ncbi:hypothetical protein L9F63_019638, partial [Diploptera punctata]